MPAESDEQREPEGGPSDRLEQFMEERFARIGSGDKEAEEPEEAPGVERFASRSLDRPEEPPRGPLPPDFRRDLVQEYRRRQRAKLARERSREPGEGPAARDDHAPDAPTPEEGGDGEGEAPIAPVQPPASNWVPIGPSVVRRGQAAGTPAMAGRISGLAVASGGFRVYAASANGGVWRSDDGGRSWRSTMDAFDLDPTSLASDSLACGAIAIDQNDPDRIYVGTGEGDTARIRDGVVVESGAYFGVGPIRSDDGGRNWIGADQDEELIAPGSPPLAGAAFYALAVDPTDRERVVAATTNGLYRREPDGSGGFHWAQKRLALFTSVVVAGSGAAATFWAAQWGGGVLISTDGNTWVNAGRGFPTSDVGRIGLAVRPTDPSVVYALIARRSNRYILGVWRLDALSGAWTQVTGHPGDLFGKPTANRSGQGGYDLAIAVDPNNPSQIYLGGSTRSNGIGGADQWAASLYRCTVTITGSGGGLSASMSTTPIGGAVHADVHALTFVPRDSQRLYVGCDGGVFFTSSATGAASFEPRNTGLQNLHMEHLGQHPTEDAVLFCGTQDNGTLRFTGEEAWLHSAPGDGGFVVVNWRDPYRVLVTYPGGVAWRFDDGGSRYNFSDASLPLEAGADCQAFYAPLAGTPPNRSNPIQAERVAYATNRVWVSDTFASTWASIPSNTIQDRLGPNGPSDCLTDVGKGFRIRSLAFAGADRIYAGLMNGRVYRYDRAAAGWGTAVRIDNLGGPDSLPADFAIPVTDIAVDRADDTGGSIYIAFGGIADHRRVWHWDGRRWQPRSGPAAGSLDALLNVQVNAIVVDPANPDHLWVGADIGVWHSPDAGVTWEPFSEGLPDAGVFDLQLHAVRRLLRASTHGRGVYERALDPAPARAVELYVRDTQLDQGRVPTVDGLPDPIRLGQTVGHDRGPDIKLDTPDANGRHQFSPTSDIDFLQFVDVLVDDAERVAARPSAVVTTRVYVQVHNRGVTPASGVRVMLLVAEASTGPPPLPPGYSSNLQSGTPIATPSWRTVGFATLDNVRVGFPKIAAFDLTSDLLPPSAGPASSDQHCVLVLVHHPVDPFTATETATDLLSTNERKAAQKRLTVVRS
jgi:hypothetical protein